MIYYMIYIIYHHVLPKLSKIIEAILLLLLPSLHKLSFVLLSIISIFGQSSEIIHRRELRDFLP